MKVRCIKTDQYKYIAKDKIYDVIDINDGGYKIINNGGNSWYRYSKELFEVVGEKVMDYKYKVGDKVVASKYLNVGQFYDGGCLFKTEMKKDAEEIMEIAECFKNYKGDNRYRIKNSIWAWSDSMLCIVEGKKMEVVKIKEWSNLNGVKNDKYELEWSERDNSFQVNLPNKTNYYVADIEIDKANEETIIAWLKLFGFNIEFIKSPLEQVKEYIAHKKSNIKAITIRDDYNNGYADGEMSALNALLLKIERIEKDEH
jgi:hypothetical protein